MRQLLGAGLSATATLWPAIQVAYAWVLQAAHILGDNGPCQAAAARQLLDGLLGAMTRHRGLAGTLARGVDHFVRVSRSYWPGLFACYEVADLPRTNNDLEQFFGSYRYHERRASGRPGSAPSTVLRGEVRLLAAAATRQHIYTAEDLAGTDPTKRAELRARLEARRQRRVRRTRFRRNPQAFLQQLEEQLLRSALPS